MIYIFGNSHERVPIKDLGDVIYYRQKKQYTEQEFQKSRDLQREIQLGRIIKLDQQPEIRNSIPDNLTSPAPTGSVSNGADIHDIRRVITEVITEYKSNSSDTRDMLMGLIPLITDTVREEISKIPVQQVVVSQSGPSQSNKSTFVGPEYIPDVNMDGLKSNVTIEGQNVSSEGVTDSLEALKRLSRST